MNAMQCESLRATIRRRLSERRGGCRRTRLGALLLAGLASAVAAQDYTHPRAMDLPAPAFERPDPMALQLRLDNGVVAYVAEDRRAPLATITAYLAVGSGHGQPGEAQALATALRAGPADMDRGEFAATLERLFADFSVTTHHEETVLSLDVPAGHAGTAVDLMARLLATPAFGAGAAATAATGSTAPPRGGIDYAYTLAGAVKVFEERLFAGHAFGRAATPEQQTTARETGARRLHAARVRGDRLTLSLAGDIDPRRARRELQSAFARIAAPESTESDVLFSQPEALGSRELLLADVDRDQGWVVIGHALPVVPEADEAALAVMDYILGAYHLDSRLYRESRELRGLTNDNSSFLSPGVRGPGTYSFRTYGRPEAVRLLVALTFRELETMRSTLPSDDELFVARGALVDGLWATRYATGLDATRAYAQEWLRYGSHARSATYPQRVQAVTAADVQAAARKYLHPERMIVSVLGPLARIAAAPAIEGEPPLGAWGTNRDKSKR